jgi:D-alanine-D-alanine ligase
MARNGRIRLAVLFGGRSAEHAISLRSARAVMEQLDPDRYEVRPIGITREGGWLGEVESRALLAGEAPVAAGGPPFLPDGVDCLFPVLHGPGGEDGTLQGWAELCGVPCVGSPALGSALAMDKGACKHVLRDAGVPVLPWTEVPRRDFLRDPAAETSRVADTVGLPCFVKPIALGSSIGVGRADDLESLRAALDEALRHGGRALAEPEFDGRELEVAVLEGEPPVVSPPGEIRTAEWYDYVAKYESDSAQLLMPAPDVPQAALDTLREDAARSFRALRLAGMARVDFFLGREGEVLVNEVNTIPGFTSISMYPRLMELCGIPFAALCDRLVELALERAASEGELQAEDRTA